MFIFRWSLRITVLLVLYSRLICAFAHQPAPQRDDAAQLASDISPRSDNTVYARAPRIYAIPDGSNGRTLQVDTRPIKGGKPILAQAVFATIVQSLYEAYNDFGSSPNSHRNSFQHEEAALGPESATFWAILEVQETQNMTVPNRLTNSRLVEALSLIGFELTELRSVDDLQEFEFDILLNKFQAPQILIAKGSVKNLKPDNRSLPSRSVAASVISARAKLAGQGDE